MKPRVFTTLYADKDPSATSQPLELDPSSAACSSESDSILSDLIRQIPSLLDVMPSESFASLAATSREHRSQIHSAVMTISIADSTYASAVINGQWPRLKSWTSTHKDQNGCTTIQLSCDMTAAAASVLAKANMPQQWYLHLTCEHLAASVIGEMVKGQWPTLQCLTFGRAKLTAAAIQEPAAGKWPSLKCLMSQGMAEDADAISVFASAEMPELKVLHLSPPKETQPEIAGKIACVG